MSDCHEYLGDAVPDAAKDAVPNAAKELPIKGHLHGSMDATSDCLVLTHGAGSNCHSPLLVALAEAFAETGLAVLRCDLMFRLLRPLGPPSRGSGERDQMGLRAVVTSLKKRTTGRIFLGGHSYGGRQASILAADEPSLVNHLLLLSYPLHPPQRPGELRTAHFPRLEVPAMFIQGTRDGFGSIEEMTASLELIPAPTKLIPITGAGHDLLGKRNREEKAREIAQSFCSFANRAG